MVAGGSRSRGHFGESHIDSHPPAPQLAQISDFQSLVQISESQGQPILSDPQASRSATERGLSDLLAYAPVAKTRGSMAVARATLVDAAAREAARTALVKDFCANSNRLVVEAMRLAVETFAALALGRFS